MSLAAAYAVSSFLWSFTGFFFPAGPGQSYEYSFSGLATEVGGHFLFGALVGLASSRIGLAALGGAEAVLIDSDHVLASLGFPVLGRLSHSVPFAAAMAVVFLLLPLRMQARGVLVAVTIGSILSHLSYDVLAGDGQFPLLAPFTNRVFVLPYWSWPLLEVGGLVMVASVRFHIRQRQDRRLKVEQFSL